MEIMRLQKFLSSAGVCSRRQAEELITRGEVKVNGQVAQLGDKVDPETDKVEVKGKLVGAPAEKKIYILLNKPAGYTATRSDRFAEKTIYDLLPAELRTKVWPVGRLDKNSCGLLILTNDGELTQKLTHPSFQHEKEYLVEFTGLLTKERIDQLQNGIETERIQTLPCRVEVLRPNLIQVTIREGQKRQVREMLGAVHCHVNFLQRTRENKIRLGDVPEGGYKFITKREII